MGVERTSGTDTRTETTDSPDTRDRPYTPPPDNPGSDGQPSRLESRRIAREAQQARAAELAAQESGTEQTDRPREDVSETSSTELPDETQESTDEPENSEETRELAETERDPDTETGETEPASAEGQTDTGQAERPEAPDEEPAARDANRTAPEPPDETAQAQDTGTPQERDHHPLPQREEQPSDTADRDTGREGTTEQTPQPRDEPPAEGHETEDEQTSAPADQRAAEDQPDTSEPAPPQTDTPAPRPGWPPAANDSTTRWSTSVYRMDDRTPGTEAEPRDRNAESRPETSTANDETNNYRELPDVSRDGTPGRGELRPPEDDPADRNPDPEEAKRSRWEVFEGVKDGVEAGKKVMETAQNYLGKPPPPTRAEARTNTPDLHAPHSSTANPTDPAIGSMILAVAIVGTIKKINDKVRQMGRRRNESN